MISAIVAQAVVKLVAKQFKLDKILSYVEEPNDADERIDKLEMDVFKLQSIINVLEESSHKPRNFIICEDCKKKIKEKK
tara:strand:- start:432 stop:668 length:237 start_codon:yes stop_codon:yes gene_type:complete